MRTTGRIALLLGKVLTLCCIEVAISQPVRAGDIVNAYDMAAGLIHGASECKIDLSDTVLLAFVSAASKRYELSADEKSELSGMVFHDPNILRPVGKFYFTRMKWTCDDVSTIARAS